MAVAETSPSPSRSSGPAKGRVRDRGRSAVIGFLTLREGSIIVVTLVTFAYFAVSTDNFLSSANFKTLLPYFAPYAILAAGEVFVMILGEIDLSIGAVYLIAPFLFQKITTLGIGLLPSVIVTVLIACAIGAFNGTAVAYVGISSFVATLGMLFVLDGLTLVIAHSTPINTPGTTTIGLNTFGQVFGGGTYSELFWALGIVFVLQIGLSFTRWGIFTVATGGNRLGAAEAGIRTRWIIVRNFVLCSACAGFVGILEAVRVTTATPDPSGSNDILFQAISAAVIGGTLLQGGSGTVVGALIGAIFLGILHDGLIIKGVSANYLYLYLGLAILIAMAMNVLVQRVRTGSGRG